MHPTPAVDSVGSYGFPQSRPGWKPWLVCTLLCLVPVVGWSMATMYWLTRHHPHQYDAGAAAGAGLMLLLMVIVAYVIVMLLFALLLQV